MLEKLHNWQHSCDLVVACWPGGGWQLFFWKQTPLKGLQCVFTASSDNIGQMPFLFAVNSKQVRQRQTSWNRCSSAAQQSRAMLNEQTERNVMVVSQLGCVLLCQGVGRLGCVLQVEGDRDAVWCQVQIFMPLVHLICIPSLCMGSRATAAFRYSALPCRYLAFEEHSSCSIIHVSNILSPSSDLWSDHFLCVARQLGKYPGVLLVSSLGGKNWPE